MPTNDIEKRLARWMLLHEKPADLPLDHPAQKDIADAWDEIRRLNSALCALRQTARAALSHVAYANYEHREAAAAKAISKSFATGEYVDPDDM